MLRHVQSELLDTLPFDDREAQRSRRDLVRINALMGNWRWLARTLATHLRAGDRLLELGAGRGEFLLWWARRHPGPAARVTVTAVDLAPRPVAWPAHWTWQQGDLLSDADLAEADVVIANLVLHHFELPALRTLGEQLELGANQANASESIAPRAALASGRDLSGAELNHSLLQERGNAREPGERGGPRVLLLCEPARRHLHVWQARALALLGMGRVTRHDAPASVRAGFVDGELPAQLGLTPPRWRTTIEMSWAGAYRVVAERTQSTAVAHGH